MDNNHNKMRVLLFPPLDDNVDGDDSPSSSVMSETLRSKFEALKKKGKGKCDETDDRNSKRALAQTADASDSATDTNIKEGANEDDVNSIKRQRLAHETAVLARNEVERMQNSVKELEALLLAQRQKQVDGFSDDGLVDSEGDGEIDGSDSEDDGEGHDSNDDKDDEHLKDAVQAVSDDEDGIEGEEEEHSAAVEKPAEKERADADGVTRS